MQTQPPFPCSLSHNSYYLLIAFYRLPPSPIPSLLFQFSFLPFSYFFRLQGSFLLLLPFIFLFFLSFYLLLGSIFKNRSIFNSPFLPLLHVCSSFIWWGGDGTVTGYRGMWNEWEPLVHSFHDHYLHRPRLSLSRSRSRPFFHTINQ